MTSAASSSFVFNNNNKEVAFSGQWQSIQTAFQQSDKITFTYGHMITYFVNRKVADGLPSADDFKSINSVANNLFEGGHIQNIEIGKSEECIFILSNCLPEMRKDRVCKAVISLHKDSFDIVTALCGCPTGKGQLQTYWSCMLCCCFLLYIEKVARF